MRVFTCAESFLSIHPSIHSVMNYLSMFSSTGPTIQSMEGPLLRPPAAQTSVTATTPPIIPLRACRCRGGAGRPRVMPLTANLLNTTWTLTQTQTPTLHPLPHALSTCLLRKAAPRPLPLNVPTSTCAPLLPPPAPTHHDPPTARGIKGMKWTHFFVLK